MKNLISALIDRLVDAVVAFAMRTPYHHLRDYMNRYWILKPHWWTLGCSIRVHQILRSDDDRHLHDHPWPFVTLILRGGYTEILKQDIVTREELFNRKIEWPEDCELIDFHALDSRHAYLKSYGRHCSPGSILWHRANHAHRLILKPGHHAWTLFFMGPRKHTWGFYTEKGKVAWNDYLSEPDVAAARAAHALHGFAE